MASLTQENATLSLHIASAANLSTHANSAFCTLLLWSNTSQGGPGSPMAQPKYTSFGHVRDEAVEWNENLHVDVDDSTSAVLTVRVKDSCDALVGSCNVYLSRLHPREELDQWFQLHPIGHIRLKLTLTLNYSQPAPSPVTNPPYMTDFQAIFQRELERQKAVVQVALETQRQARTAQQSPPLPPSIAMILEAQNQAQENARLMIAQQLQQQQQQSMASMASLTQAYSVGGFPTTTAYPPQQGGAIIHDMMGTAANISTVAANMQQLSGNSAGTGSGAFGTVASIGLGALGLGPMGAFFGA